MKSEREVLQRRHDGGRPQRTPQMAGTGIVIAFIGVNTGMTAIDCSTVGNLACYILLYIASQVTQCLLV
jgi:hypothetical protein